MKRALVLGLLLAAVAVTALLINRLQREGSSLAEIKRGDVVLMDAQTIERRFALLSRRHTNKCGLAPESLEKIAANGRLQGSCCRPMVLERYIGQVRDLGRYRAVPEIPADPYDVPLALAQRLVSYDRTITLTPAQQATYDQAVLLSDEGGPCCCHCWRWSAFEGQAKYLISHRDYSSRQVAETWGFEDGCGGPGETA